MKRKNLTSLKLNKHSISNLDNTKKVHIIKGGTGIRCDLSQSFYFVCDDTSANGCTTTPDETMTCADWSCTCPQN